MHDYGLMRPVARIAQSVEQGIENPRVLGSIPSPGTTYLKKPAYGLVFCFWGFGPSSETITLLSHLYFSVLKSSQLTNDSTS